MDVLSLSYPDACSTVGLAARLGKTEALQELLDKNTDYTVKDNKGWYPMHDAAFYGHLECVKLLLKTAKRDCESMFEILEYVFPPSFDGSTPLSLAASEGHSDIVKLLINFYIETQVGVTEMGFPLHQSCINGHIECIRILTDKLPNCVNLPGQEGQYPLHITVEKENMKATKVLIQKGALVNVKDSIDLKTPLHIAASLDNEEIVKILLEQDCDVNATDIASCTPLYLAAQNGNDNIIDILLFKGAKPSKFMLVEDLNLKSYPLSVAAEKGHLSAVKILADITPIEHCLSAVILAALNKHNECLLYLFDKGFSTFQTSSTIAGKTVWDLLLGENRTCEDYSKTIEILLNNDTSISSLAKTENNSYFKFFLLPMRFNDVNIAILKTFLNAGLLELRYDCSNFPNLKHLISGHKMLQGRLALNSEYAHFIRKLAKISLCLQYFPFLAVSHKGTVVATSVENLQNGELIQMVPSLLALSRWIVRCCIIKSKCSISLKYVSPIDIPQQLKEFLLYC